MIQKKAMRWVVVSFALVSAMIAGCDGSSDAKSAPENPLVGTWSYVLPEDASIPAGTYSYTFSSTDYTFEYFAPGETSAINYEDGTYTYDESTITMIPTKRLGIAVKTSVSTISSYKILDSVLTLTDEDYGSTDYRKQ